MKKLMIAVALALAVVGGTMAISAVTGTQPHAAPCSGPNC
jgi:hypothetical protein